MKHFFKRNSLMLCMALIVIGWLTSCTKESELEPQKTTKSTSPSNFSRTAIKNPYSIDNIKESLRILGRTEALPEEQIYHYYKFNPSMISGEILTRIETDSTSKILDIPLADASLYSEDNREMTEDDMAAYKDGNLYIVFNAKSDLRSIFEGADSSQATKINELFLPNADDEDLQIQALITSGYTDEVSVSAFKLHWPCLLKRPHGRVTYTDNFNNTTVAVPQIQVWALVFGIPVHTYTDSSGNYSIPWRFSAGTFMGTHAKNSRANIKPLTTTGSILSAIGQNITNFILGSVHWEGWFGSCAMKNNINIHFGSHGQKRYWAQLLHIIKLHYDYTGTDGINHAPTSLAVYAQWDSANGQASTPMLGHIQTSPISLFANMASVLFNTNLSSTAPNLFNLMTGLLPDMTFKVSSTQDSRYSERLMETGFHELGHASLFTKVGQVFWVNVITNIISASGSSCGGYGCGTETAAGYTQVNEAWAEFIAKEYHRRIHSTGLNLVRLAGSTTLSWQQCPLAQENVPWYGNDWINTGIFYDLLDPSNETYDKLAGYSIKNMYNSFSPNTNSFCKWRTSFIQNNPTISITDLDNLMILQNGFAGGCK